MTQKSQVVIRSQVLIDEVELEEAYQQSLRVSRWWKAASVGAGAALALTRLAGVAYAAGDHGGGGGHSGPGGGAGSQAHSAPSSGDNHNDAHAANTPPSQAQHTDKPQAQDQHGDKPAAQPSPKAGSNEVIAEQSGQRAKTAQQPAKPAGDAHTSQVAGVAIQAQAHVSAPQPPLQSGADVHINEHTNVHVNEHTDVQVKSDDDQRAAKLAQECLDSKESTKSAEQQVKTAEGDGVKFTTKLDNGTEAEHVKVMVKGHEVEHITATASGGDKIDQRVEHHEQGATVTFTTVTRANGDVLCSRTLHTAQGDTIEQSPEKDQSGKFMLHEVVTSKEGKTFSHNVQDEATVLAIQSGCLSGHVASENEVEHSINDHGQAVDSVKVQLDNGKEIERQHIVFHEREFDRVVFNGPNNEECTQDTQVLPNGDHMIVLTVKTVDQRILTTTTTVTVAGDRDVVYSEQLPNGIICDHHDVFHFNGQLDEHLTFKGPNGEVQGSFVCNHTFDSNGQEHTEVVVDQTKVHEVLKLTEQVQGATVPGVTPIVQNLSLCGINMNDIVNMSPTEIGNACQAAGTPVTVTVNQPPAPQAVDVTVVQSPAPAPSVTVVQAPAAQPAAVVVTSQPEQTVAGVELAASGSGSGGSTPATSGSTTPASTSSTETSASTGTTAPANSTATTPAVTTPESSVQGVSIEAPYEAPVPEARVAGVSIPGALPDTGLGGGALAGLGLLGVLIGVGPMAALAAAARWMGRR